MYRNLGIFLVLVGVGSVAAHHAGLALPSLHWFFGFESKDAELVDASWGKKNQALVVGYVLSGLVVLGGVLSLLKSGRGAHRNPQTIRKIQRFKSIGRGYLSLIILSTLLFLALLGQVLVGKRALVVNYEGQIYVPALWQETYTDEDFGGEAKSEVDYRKLKKRFKEEGKGNWLLLPLVPFDPTFDSEEEIRSSLESRDGVFYREGEGEPYTGLSYRFYADEPKKRHSMVKFRAGLQQGREEYYDRNGDLAGVYKWTDGIREADPIMGADRVEAVEAEETTNLLAVRYPPLPPSLKTRHLLGTDSRGWDVLAQLFGGLQVVFQAAMIYLVITYSVGVTLGCLMGYLGGRFDIVTQRFIEVLANVPFLYVVIIIADRIGRDNINLVTILLVICIFSWIHITYYMRTATYKEKARDYVAAARVLGAGPFRVIFRHVLPNAISTLVTLLPFSVAAIITALTALDFIGFGLPDTYPSWGRLLADGVSNLDSPWIVASVFSGMVAVLLLVTFVGEAVREAFDPKKFTTYR